MTPSLYITPIAGLVGLALAFVFYRAIAKRSGGEGKIAEIAEKIHRGSMVFMKREFILISVFALVIGACLFFFQEGSYGPQQSLAFFLGALASSFAGYVGMNTATKANVRTTLAAHNEGCRSCAHRRLLRWLRDGTHRCLHGTYRARRTLSHLQ